MKSHFRKGKTMENYLFLDTETTGFRKNGGLKQEGQARVCQIAMILTDNEGGILAEYATLIKPDGWKISSGAEECHGISQNECEIYGLPAQLMMKNYEAMAEKAGVIIAHQALFDKAMMEIETVYANNIKAIQKSWFCTMENNTQVCKIPPTEKMKAAGRFNYKTPSLAETYEFYTGKKIEGAHDAMVDARACKDIFFAMRRVSHNV